MTESGPSWATDLWRTVAKVRRGEEDKELAFLISLVRENKTEPEGKKQTMLQACEERMQQLQVEEYP